MNLRNFLFHGNRLHHACDTPHFLTEMSKTKVTTAGLIFESMPHCLNFAVHDVQSHLSAAMLSSIIHSVCLARILSQNILLVASAQMFRNIFDDLLIFLDTTQ